MRIISRLKQIFQTKSDKPEVSAPAPVEVAPSVPNHSPQTGPDIFYTIASSGGRPPEVLEPLIVKTRRRAERHFKGGTVKHRVTRREDGLIEFSFSRRAGVPIRIAWQERKSA